MYQSKFISFIMQSPLFSFVIWPSVNFKFHNGWKKWKEKRTESESNKKRSSREIFFKRAFYEMLTVNKAMVNSKVSSGKGNNYFEKYTTKTSLCKKYEILIFKAMSQTSNHLPKLLANAYMVPFKGSVSFLFLCKPCVIYSMFPHKTQKILTTDTFRWLLLIPNSQLSIDIQFEKNSHSVFLKLQKIFIFLVYILRLWKLTKDNTRRCLHCM